MNDASLKVYAQIWFAQWWRMILWMALGFIVLTVIMFVIVFGAMTLTGSREIAGLSLTLNVIGFVVGMAIGFWAWMKSMRGVLDKNYGGWRLQLVRAPVQSLTTDSGAK